MLKKADGSPLCTSAVRITINFGPQKSGYVHYSELEVLGRAAEGGVYLPQWHTGSWKDSGFTPAPAGAPNVLRGVLRNSIYLGEVAQHEFAPHAAASLPPLKAFETNPRRIARDENTPATAWIDPEDVTVFPA